MENRAVALAAVVLAALVASSAYVLFDNRGDAEDSPPETITTSVSGVAKYGHIGLEVTRSEMADAGYAAGDFVVLSFSDRTYTSTFFDNFNGAGAMTVFTSTYGSSSEQIAIGVFNADSWSLMGCTVGESVTLSYGGVDEDLVKVPNYLAGIRADDQYPDTYSYCNFRLVDSEHAAGKIYRSSSPFLGTSRSAAVCDLLEENEVQSVLCLHLATEQLYALSLNSAYVDRLQSGGCVSACYINPTVAFSPDDMRCVMSTVMEMFETYDNVCVNCEYGKDRTGIVVAILLAVAGDSYADIQKDFSITLSNYYGIEEGSEECLIVMNGLLDSIFYLLGNPQLLDDPMSVDYDDLDTSQFDANAMVRTYLRYLGFTDEQIDRLHDNLVS